MPVFTSRDILLFGSIYAIDDNVATVMKSVLSAASDRQSLIVYDPNVRKSSVRIGDDEKVRKNFNCSTIIRDSEEDFATSFGATNFEEACSYIPDLDSKVFIYTCAEKGVYLKTPNYKAFFKGSIINPI